MGIAAAFCVAAFSQTHDFNDPEAPVGPVVNLVDGPVTVKVSFGLPPDMAGVVPVTTDASTTQNPTVAGLAFYTANYTSLGGKQLPFHIVGTDPALGANTTTIPTVIVPIKFIFPNAGNPTLDGSNVVTATANSPIFLTADYKAGSVDLGVTQYGDALQRAEFWNLPGFSPNYHVLLGTPSVAPTVTITVPAGKGNAYALSGGGFQGVVDTAYFVNQLNALIPSYTANELPIFLTDNVFLGTSGLIQNCCILGYHDSQGPPIASAKTWIYAAYTEPAASYSDDFGNNMSDVMPLSHEVAEWLNDPFSFAGVNWVPPAVLPGQGYCQTIFETGDPLESDPFSVPWTFTKVTNGTVYNLQDEVTLPWYLHTTPSFSVNGWYTFQNLSFTVPLVINAPPSIAGTYTNTAVLAWAPVNTTVTQNVVYVGRGCPGDAYLADPSGKIALIDRGVCAVSLKVDRAATAGAKGVVIGLVAPGDPFPFLYGGGTNFVPSVVITQALSNSIKGALGGGPVNATISQAPPSFSSLCGPG